MGINCAEEGEVGWGSGGVTQVKETGAIEDGDDWLGRNCREKGMATG